MLGVLTRRPALRWAVPAAVAVAALGGSTVGHVLTADAAPALPPRTAAQLLVDLQTANPAGLSGTVVQKSDLGLPDLDALGGQGSGSQGSSDPSALLTGTHTLRIWYGGKDKQRVALLGTLGESDVVRNGLDVWAWSSKDSTAVHTKLSADAARRPAKTPSPSPLPSTPQQAADEALAAISPTTTVSTDGTAKVAGRSAYELVLAPKDATSRVGEVRLAIDADTKIPLRVRVLARGSASPAFEVGFTEITYKAPSAAQFRFTPPPGTKVTERAFPDPSSIGSSAIPVGSRPTIVGKGWTSVAVFKNVKLPADGGVNAVLAKLPRVSGAWGSGRLLSSRLVCALLTDDGRLIVGAVDPAVLYRAAAAK
jgi:outer membrane lipoprotein-sorting protein